MSDEEREPQSEEAKTLGLERWVQFAFVVVGLVTFFFSDKLYAFLYELIALYGERWFSYRLPSVDDVILTGIAAVTGLLAGYFGYRNKKISPRAHEVAHELSKVTWPSRRETWYSTIVVVVTSVIAAVYLGVFDALWSAFTDLIYTTS